MDKRRKPCEHTAGAKGLRQDNVSRASQLAESQLQRKSRAEDGEDARQGTAGPHRS